MVNPQIWKVDYTLNNPRVKEEITRETEKYFGLTDMENVAQSILWDTLKTVLNEKCIAQY